MAWPRLRRGSPKKKNTATGSSSTTTEPTTTPAPAASELPDGLEIGNQIGLAYHYGADTAWNEVLQSAVDQAIDPEDYICNAPTTFQLWANEEVGMIDPVSLTVLAMLGVPGWPAGYKVILDSENSDEFIGTFGQATREQIKRHKDNQRFWDVRTDDILLMGMNGAGIGDDSKMLDLINLYIAFGVLPPFLDAQTVVDTVQAIIEGGVVNLEPVLGVPLVFDLPGVPGRYDHPLFTLNAFAFTDRGLGALLGIEIPDKIIMGDGLLEGLDAIGLGTNGPDFVHAHEFAHHVQFETPGAIPPPAATPEDQAEVTRRTELMADGFGAYYSSHARGATFQAKRFAAQERSHPSCGGNARSLRCKLCNVDCTRRQIDAVVSTNWAVLRQLPDYVRRSISCCYVDVQLTSVILSPTVPESGPARRQDHEEVVRRSCTDCRGLYRSRFCRCGHLAAHW